MSTEDKKKLGNKLGKISAENSLSGIIPELTASQGVNLGQAHMLSGVFQVGQLGNHLPYDPVFPTVTASAVAGKYSNDVFLTQHITSVIDPLTVQVIQGSPILQSMGVQVHNGQLTLEGNKPWMTIESEDKEAKLKGITDELTKKQKSIEGELHLERNLRQSAEKERKQADERISQLEEQLTSLVEATKAMRNFLRPVKGMKHTKVNVPKVQYVYRSIVLYENGKFSINSKPVHFEPVLAGLLTLFISRGPGVLVTYDDIREECYPAEKRYSVVSKTLAKYVSKLGKSLEVHDIKNVIFNEREQGWMLAE